MPDSEDLKAELKKLGVEFTEVGPYYDNTTLVIVAGKRYKIIPRFDYRNEDAYFDVELQEDQPCQQAS